MAQELKACTFDDIVYGDADVDADYYRKSEVDTVLAEKDAEIERLNNALDKERSETIKYMDELCNAKNEIERLTIDKRNNELRADVADATIEKLKAEIAGLKNEINRKDGVGQRWFERCMEARTENRMLERALWLARAERYKMREFIAREEANLRDQMAWSQFLRERTYNQWVDQLLRIANLANKLYNKCRAKAEEYK